MKIRTIAAILFTNLVISTTYAADETTPTTNITQNPTATAPATSSTDQVTEEKATMKKKNCKQRQSRNTHRPHSNPAL